MKAYRIFKEVNVMVSKEVVVKNGTGLHARPATLLVKKASSFKCKHRIQW